MKHLPGPAALAAKHPRRRRGPSTLAAGASAPAPHGLAAMGLLALAAGLSAPAALAQPAGAAAARLFENPPVLGRTLDEPAPAVAAAAAAHGHAHGERLLSAAAPSSKAPLPTPRRPNLLGLQPSERLLDLDVVYTTSQLYNPATGNFDKVRLRSYAGTRVDPHQPFVAPSIEVKPGETLRISLNNKLPPDPSCNTKASKDADASGAAKDSAAAQDAVNTPHCFNGTNLHTHGLWVSPAGNSDNVTLAIDPGMSFQYEYNVPADHPAGTFWYHTHLHGSTALQVGSGMAGALVVRGERKPTPRSNGDLDTLLREPGGKPLAEKVLLMQQIPYACGDTNGTPNWNCKPGETGTIESYSQFAYQSWEQSGRYTSINGIVLPRLQATAGKLERWRLIHGGVSETISLQVREMSAPVGPLDKLTVPQEQRGAFVDQACAGKPVPVYVAASDGLTMARIQPKLTVTLQPGYRNDLLLALPREGRYCLVNASAEAAANVSKAGVSRKVLGFVEAGRGEAVADTPAFVKRELVRLARANMPADVRAQVVADLQDGLRLDKFIPHADVAESELQGEQRLVFNIDTSNPNRTLFQVGSNASDLSAYQPNVMNRTLTLGTAQSWVLTSLNGSHPFHIHVNPFQIVKILDPKGKDVSAPDAADLSIGADGKPAEDPQYRGLKGVWKDTLWVKNLGQGEKGTYQVHVRTRYQRYIGDFVLHCHILDHEDQGMMQNVTVQLPNAPAAPAKGHQH